MRAIVKSNIQRDLGIAMFKAGGELLSHLTGRVLVSTLPDEMKELPDGILPKVEHEIANDPRLQSFFQHERVIGAAGGINAMEAWATRFTGCQYCGDEQPRQLETRRYGHAAMRICWGCDNKTDGHISPKLDAIANVNMARWVVATAKWRLKSEGQLTIPELILWAAISGVVDLIPNDVSAQILGLPKPIFVSGPKKESDMQVGPAPTEVLTKTAIKVFTVDPEPPKAFMLRPKLTRVEDSKWTRWVKTQKCCGCGERADDPHHIIGHGFSGMATKPCDYLTIPLCRTCHRNLHDSPAAWEAEHGSQTDLFAQFFNYSVGMGAIS
ncbi:MAG TPA: hypothetical protein DHV72_23145 [Serratia grimesii]|uniref:HNH nuclease domain-containing protein n=1 Tax=Serratia grimesii TaxID=82995 RepID=A0A9C7V9X3_9GAMM|nr:hypothetical protein [Serratia grimesii]